MPQLRIAHLHEQGQNIVIALMDPSFGMLSDADQQAAIAEIQLAARSAGLAGVVVPYWRQSANQSAFIAPPEWHAFFRSISLDFVVANLNRTLSW